MNLGLQRKYASCVTINVGRCQLSMSVICACIIIIMVLKNWRSVFKRTTLRFCKASHPSPDSFLTLIILVREL